MPTCLIGIGSNLGDRETNIASAVSQLAQQPHVQVIATSGLLENPPLGGPTGQGEFLNAVTRIETTLSADELLDVLHIIEQRLGRIREAHWGPRTIDLDLLLYSGEIIETAKLQVPHPRMHERFFVLAPAAEVGSELVHPKWKCTIGELLANYVR